MEINCHKFGYPVAKEFCKGFTCGNCERKIKYPTLDISSLIQKIEAGEFNSSNKVKKRKSLPAATLKNFIYNAYQLSAIFTCYLEILRRSYLGTLTDDESSVTQKIQAFIDKLYQDLINQFSLDCEAGETYRISAILEALGEYSFTQTWFIDGLKTLYAQGRGLKFPKTEKENDYRTFFKEMKKFEKKNQKYDSDSKTKSQYYEQTPRKIEILAYHYAVGFKNETLHKQLLSYYKPIENISELLNYCNKSIL